MSCFLSISTHSKGFLKGRFNVGDFIGHVADELQAGASCWALVPENRVVGLDRVREVQVDVNIWCRQHFSWSLRNLIIFPEVNPCRQMSDILYVRPSDDGLGLNESEKSC